MNKKDLDIVAAGHICLDIIPAFTIDKPVEKMTDVLVPGKMINMGKCVVVGGVLSPTPVSPSAGLV